MSNTAPVENEQSAEASQHTSAAISSTCTKRLIGILDSMYWMCFSVIWSKIAVFAAAGVTQFTSTPDCASSLPSDLVSEMTPALDAEYATALGLRSEEHTSELQSRLHLVCRLLLEKKKASEGGVYGAQHQAT